MTDPAAEALSQLLLRHRSIRAYKPDPIDPALIERICAEAVAGSSSSGNLNSFSMVLTEDPARRDQLCKLHGGQAMIRQAPLLITFCADQFHTRAWLRLRGARDNFDNLQGFLVAAFDAIIVAQSVALACEAHGLGICYLGTTLFAAGEISKFLELPETCMPVTSMVVGWPGEDPAKRDRLPAGIWLHRETYRQHDDAGLADLHAEREAKGWARYRTLRPALAQAMDAQGITSLAQFYTSDLKYAPALFDALSRKLYRVMRDKRFIDRLAAEVETKAQPG